MIDWVWGVSLKHHEKHMDTRSPLPTRHGRPHLEALLPSPANRRILAS